MIKEVLNEYKEKYNLSFENNFLGDLKRLALSLSNPNLMLSKKCIDLIYKEQFRYKKPLQVGVIGQFSSGKSSLLNLLFKKDILATGARPVSMVATYINYGLNDLVLAEFEDKISQINDEIVNDQNEDVNGLKNISIYTNNEILKNVTLIDTPGLNANNKDEEFTKELFSSFDALIWLCLAESAGKLSEEKAIKSLNPHIKKICLINQKDKLNISEQERLQKYMQNVFSKYFEKIELISCKQASKNNANSNINAFYDFLLSLNKEEIKVTNIKYNINIIKNELICISDSINKSLDELKYKIENYLDIVKNINSNCEKFNNNILNALSSMAKTIANEFVNNFKEKTAFFYTKKDSFLHKDCFSKNEYSFKTLLPDDTFLNIFYNKDLINKQFLKIKKELNEEFLNIISIFKKALENIILELNILKTKEINKNYKDLVKSDFYAISDDFFKALNELIINDYEKAFYKYELKLNQLFEKINIKALNNYENATKLALSFFYEKINASREFYELDNTQFKLYLPSDNEIYQRLLNDCSFYEFEDLLVNKKQIYKLEKEYLQELESILHKHLISIENRQNKLQNIKENILTAFMNFL